METLTSDLQNLPLQVVNPSLYQALAATLGNRGLNPGDVDAFASTSLADEGLAHAQNILCIRFGDEFQEIEQWHSVTPIRDVNSTDVSILEFFQHVADICHDTLKQEYRAFMKKV